MNIEVICPVCGDMFKTAVTERELNNYTKRVKCSSCWKSFFLQRASWRIAKTNEVRAGMMPTGQKKDSTTRKKARSKWSKKAHGEMEKQIRRERNNEDDRTVS